MSCPPPPKAAAEASCRRIERLLEVEPVFAALQEIVAAAPPAAAEEAPAAAEAAGVSEEVREARDGAPYTMHLRTRDGDHHPAYQFLLDVCAQVRPCSSSPAHAPTDGRRAYR